MSSSYPAYASSLFPVFLIRGTFDVTSQTAHITASVSPHPTKFPSSTHTCRTRTRVEIAAATPMRHFSLTKLLAFSSFTSTADGLQQGHSAGANRKVQRLSEGLKAFNDSPDAGRRSVFKFAFGLPIVVSSAQGARALDMDSFVNSQVRMVLSHPFWSHNVPSP